MCVCAACVCACVCVCARARAHMSVWEVREAGDLQGSDPEENWCRSRKCNWEGRGTKQG
jgi:hypothetical protein